MSNLKKIKVEPLTQEAFAPFGEVIEKYEEAKPEIVKGGLREKEFSVDAGDNKRSYFNYHTDAGQAYYPSRQGPTVFMVGPIGEPPAPEQLRAFYSDGSVGICFRAGVWHSVPIPLEREEVFKTIRGDQDFVAHTVAFDYNKEMGLEFEPDLG